MELRNLADHRCKVHTLLSLKIGLLWFFLDIFYSRSMGSKWFETVQILTTVDVLCFHKSFISFLPRDAMQAPRSMLSRGVCMFVCMFVCLSVRPSVTFVDHVKTNKHIFEIFTPSGSDTILVFTYQRGCRYSDGNPPNGDVECKGGMIK